NAWVGAVGGPWWFYPRGTRITHIANGLARIVVTRMIGIGLHGRKRLVIELPPAFEFLHDFSAGLTGDSAPLLSRWGVQSNEPTRARKVHVRGLSRYLPVTILGQLALL